MKLVDRLLCIKIKSVEEAKFLTKGTTSEDDGHTHQYEVDNDGDGKTDDTDDHNHTIKNFKVVNVEDHTHTLEMIETSVHITTNSKYKKKQKKDNINKKSKVEGLEMKLVDKVLISVNEAFVVVGTKLSSKSDGKKGKVVSLDKKRKEFKVKYDDNETSTHPLKDFKSKFDIKESTTTQTPNILDVDDSLYTSKWSVAYADGINHKLEVVEESRIDEAPISKHEKGMVSFLEKVGKDIPRVIKAIKSGKSGGAGQEGFEVETLIGRLLGIRDEDWYRGLYK